MAELIRVTFPDGEQICHKTPINTVHHVLEKIGSTRFPEITLETAGHRFVTKTVAPKLKKYAREIADGWYYINRTDTREKTAHLININRMLGLGLLIEVGDFKPLQHSKKASKSSKSKHRVQVTMPDGEVIDYDSFSDVIMACVDRLGPRNVSYKANLDLSSKCPLFATTNNTGKRLQVDEALYMALPGSAKETATVLYVIACRLKNTMKVELLPLASA